MFGMGGSEILVILVVALLFLGPEKLPSAAKQISKGIRDIKKQTRALQQTIEDDDQIGGAIRDLKSALRGDDPPVRPRPIKRPVKQEPALPAGEEAEVAEAAEPAAEVAADEANAPPRVNLPATAGEPDEPSPDDDDDHAELAKLVRPAAGTVAKGAADDSGDHG
jgi:sec-independent protein translocase protein TatB